MSVILVEGQSDRVAIEVFAGRLGLEVPTIMAIGGAHAVARASAQLRETDPDVYLVGLVDEGEVHVFTDAVDAVFVCHRDLEDELIRALGIDATMQLIDEQGELGSFGTLQKQPAQRDRPVIDQLRRFLNGRSGNKARYAALFAETIALDRVPAQILNLLAAATAQQPRREMNPRD